MTGSPDDLNFTVWPPAIDVSTPANPQNFNPQFGVTNASATDTVSLTRALLLVPVTTTGTNLAQNTDMPPSEITPGWTFSPAPAPPGHQGYAAFALSPDDGKGTIPPGGSIAFMLTGVKVSSAAGTATLRLEAKTSAGAWTSTCPIQLTTPSTTPTITRHGITPANPQTLTTLQGQAVVLTWTTTGAAYCVIKDDQGKKWENLPTSGTLADTPLQGNSEVQSTPELGRHYTRTYHFYAFSAGATQSDDRPDSVIIQLPTISSFTVTPASLAIGQQATVAWSVANIDPRSGKIHLSVTPTDGTGPYTIAISPSQQSGSGVVTPTPQTTTAYTLAVDNGYGNTWSSPSQQVASSLQPGWQKMDGLETLSIYGPLDPVRLVAFANCLWCRTRPSLSLYRTSDGTSWSPITPNDEPIWPDGLVVADLGHGEKLLAFASELSFLMSSSDGINWDDTLPLPYEARLIANYVPGDGTILVLGGTKNDGRAITDVWSTSDGRTWTQVGNSFPLIYGTRTARFAGKLQTVGNDRGTTLWGSSSSDGGKTWSERTVIAKPDFSPCLLPVGEQLVLFTAKNTRVMDSTGAWSLSTEFAPPTSLVVASAAIHNGCLWVAQYPESGSQNLVFSLLNKLLPGTTLTLTPTGNSSSE